MFFFSKLAGALLKPLSLVLVGLAVGLLLVTLTRYRRTGLSVVALATLILALISWWPVANSLIAPLEAQYPPLALQLDTANSTSPDDAAQSVQARGDVAAIVVLGGGGIDDSRLPASAQLSAIGLQRLVEGIRLWRQYPMAQLVTSGALSEGRSQAEIAAGIAVELGVPNTQISQLRQARNTEEEAAAFAAEFAAMAPSGSVLLVTSASHMPRAMQAFRHEGLSPIAAPTAHRAVARSFNRPTDFAPSATDLATTEYVLHEWFGQLWAWLRGR